MLGKSKDADSACDKISVSIPNSLANILLVERIRDILRHIVRDCETPQAKIHCHAHDVENSFGHMHLVLRATSGRPTFVRDVIIG